MTKAIIFDLNGIFIESERLSDRFNRDFDVPLGDFLGKLGGIMDQVRQPGAKPAWTYWEPVLRSWNVEMDEHDFWKYWFEAEKPSQQLIELAQELQQAGIKVFILSNNFRERANYYLGRALNDTARPDSAESDDYPWIHSAVTKVYFSWQTVFVKPDPKAWQLILDENNLRPEQCIYFDDQEKNVIAAKNLGIHSYVFENPEVTRSIVFPS